MPTEISVFLLSLQAMPLKLTTYYRGSKVLTCQAPTPSIPQSCSESTRKLRGIPPYSLWHPKMTSPLRNCLPPYVKVSACFHPASSKDVRCTVRENISITRQTKRLSSVTCCKGLPMKHCAILFSSSSATWKMPCSDTNLSETTNTSPSIGCGYATRCTASKRWKSVSARHVSGK